MTKCKEGTLYALSNGWERTFTLKLYKNTGATEDSVLVNFTEATGTNYIAKTLLWADAVITWSGTAYEAAWPDQVWSNVELLDATGTMISDGTYAYSFEDKTFGAEYTTLTVSPKITLG